MSHPDPAQGAAAKYNTVPVNGWNWWAYNENSGDTGGIVMHYWQDINWVRGQGAQQGACGGRPPPPLSGKSEGAAVASAGLFNGA